jgi:hypothetical protein
VLGQRGKAKGQPQADSSLRDTQNVALSEDVQTHFEREVLPHEVGITTFINADLIAAGLSPFAPELAARRAGRLMLVFLRLKFGGSSGRSRWTARQARRACDSV